MLEDEDESRLRCLDTICVVLVVSCVSLVCRVQRERG